MNNVPPADSQFGIWKQKKGSSPEKRAPRWSQGGQTVALQFEPRLSKCDRAKENGVPSNNNKNV